VLVSHPILLAWSAALAFAPAEGVDGKPALSLAQLPPDEELVALVWSHSADLAQSRARALSAQAEVERASKPPNPGLDLSVNTIPVGELNPPDLAAPLAHIPNYQIGLSQLVELGKRDPRRQAAQKSSEAARLDALEGLRRAFIELLDGIGRVASSEQRIAALSNLVADATELVRLQAQRAQRGDAAELDVDRARLDAERLRSTLAEERQKLEAALIDCARLAGLRCESFGTVERAQAFLDARSRPPVPPAELEKALGERPDLQSLAAQEESARSSAALARARRLPDPTFRLGFVYDTFLVSGNQNKSVYVGASLPLPIFDHGQADLAQAVATEGAARSSRALLAAQAKRDLARLLAQSEALLKRRTTMRAETLPMARAVVERLTRAAQAGGASLQDVLQARRALGELLEDAADLDLSALQVALAILRTAAPLPLAAERLLPGNGGEGRTP
jgi:cobalt-zinc-cadmium efflux system outer membrane protein